MKRIGCKIGVALLLAVLFLVACTPAVKSYTVSFEKNGGTAVADFTYTEGDRIRIEEPMRDGYHFEGWYLDEALTQAWDEKTVTGDLKLYAKWGENKNGIFQVGEEIYWFDENGEKIKGAYSFYPVGDTESETIYYFNVTGGEGLPYRYKQVNGNLWFVQDPAECIMWLLKGEEKAVLVDTASGIGSTSDLMQLILGDFPYEVVLTHYHGDHSGGIYSLSDETVIHVGKNDLYGLAERAEIFPVSGGDRYQYFTTANTRLHLVCSRDDFVPNRPMQAVGVENGDSIDVGGDRVLFYELPSHSQGSLGILFENERLMVVGDALNSNTQNQFTDAAPVETFLAAMLRLKADEDKWDGFLSSHVTTNVLNKDLLDKCIEVCQSIVETGAWEGETESTFGETVCYTALNGGGGITYRKDNIFESQNGYLKVPEDYTR